MVMSCGIQSTKLKAVGFRIGVKVRSVDVQELGVESTVLGGFPGTRVDLVLAGGRTFLIWPGNTSRSSGRKLENDTGQRKFQKNITLSSRKWKDGWNLGHTVIKGLFNYIAVLNPTPLAVTLTPSAPKTNDKW